MKHTLLTLFLFAITSSGRRSTTRMPKPARPTMPNCSRRSRVSPARRAARVSSVYWSTCDMPRTRRRSSAREPGKAGYYLKLAVKMVLVMIRCSMCLAMIAQQQS